MIGSVPPHKITTIVVRVRGSMRIDGWLLRLLSGGRSLRRISPRCSGGNAIRASDAIDDPCKGPGGRTHGNDREGAVMARRRRNQPGREAEEESPMRAVEDVRCLSLAPADAG